VNATQAKQALARAAAKVGATVEEDTGYRSMRVFQVCAPDGKVWEDGPCVHLRCDIESERSAQGLAYNDGEAKVARKRIASGLRAIRPDEVEFQERE
jgi:hypothetical protein